MRPPYVSNHKIARFLGVRVWELDKVAAHYQDEAAVILQAEYEARIEQAKRGGAGMAGPGTTLLPDF